MVLERLKIELELGFGRGKILPRIAAEVEESPKVFMDDFVSLVKTTCSNLSKLSSKLVKAKDIFPGNDLVKKVDEVLGKVAAREPSILSQDEEFFGSEDFLNALAQAEKNLIQGSEKQTTEKQMTGKKLTKKGKEKEQEYDIRKAFSLGLTPPSPAIETGPTSSTLGDIIEQPIISTNAGEKDVGKTSAASEQRIEEFSRTDAATGSKFDADTRSDNEGLPRTDAGSGSVVDADPRSDGGEKSDDPKNTVGGGKQNKEDVFEKTKK
ncbi:uncharacterized protein LOC110719950 isoform X1 [Chenopodium quinoa]|uniref:uncharacterized protein LOC110719950 isoform X1 n=1 Tax=Chenopodium quinoa TaxID=63459 RepID=UPI000B79A282|nr:uncharacterized protein LOC110719950 isoform X1 [Chenopodium quinoa]